MYTYEMLPDLSAYMEPRHFFLGHWQWGSDIIFLICDNTNQIYPAIVRGYYFGIATAIVQGTSCMGYGSKLLYLVDYELVIRTTSVWQ